MISNTTLVVQPSHATEAGALSYAWLPTTLCLVLVSLCIYAPDHYLGAKRRPELPGPKGWPLIGNSFSIFANRKRMLMHIHDLGAAFGELFTLTLPIWGRTIIINHPVWLEHMRKADTVGYGKGRAALAIFAEFPGERSAFGAEGSAWRRARKSMQSIFTMKSFNTHVSHAMGVVIPTVHDLLAVASDQNVVIDWNNLSGRIALQLFCRMALGMETDVLTNDLSCLAERHALVDSTLQLNSISSGRLFNPIWRFTDKLDGTQRRFNSAREELLEAINDLVARRRHELKIGASNHSDDFLSAFLYENGEKDPLLIRDTLITLLFASRDNTQNSFTWALYELFSHPEWVEKMRAEAAAQAPRSGGVVSYADISSYPVHMAVFYETLRLWPGVPKNARQALADDVLPSIPEHGLPSVKINRGEYVLWSDWSMGRNTKIWDEDAGTFNPARFLSREGAFERPAVPKFHSFGFGPRQCPGAQLAAYEFVALFSSILPHFDFTPVENVQRTMIDGFTIAMDGPLNLKVRARAD